MAVRFDESLPLLARVVADELGETALLDGIALRDTTGRLAFFLSTDLDPDTLERVSARIRATLGPYARSDRVIACASDFGTQEILHERTILRISVENRFVRLVDRRLVGADWLRVPSGVAESPPRFVFASMKGGVGRSTALSVAAADIASRGHRVLAIDLDMEAPGLGAMLLDEDTLPQYGLVDALVENGISGLDDAFLADLVAPSALAHHRGRIDVVPAFGRRSLNNPGDVLAKIARAYVEDIKADGTLATILDQVSSLVTDLTHSNKYDAILIDARSGLHETTAAAILGLGAEVFLFGLDEPQTFQGYAALFAHLARLKTPGELMPEWVERLTMVQGKATSTDSLAGFKEKCEELILRSGLCSPNAASATTVLLPAEPFGNVPWDDNTQDRDLNLDDRPQPREPIAILEDERFRLFEPADKRNLLSQQVYRSSFGSFLDRIDEALP